MGWNKYEVGGALLGALITGAFETVWYLAFWYLWLKPRAPTIDALDTLPVCTVLGAACGAFLGLAVGKSIEYRQHKEPVNARKICQQMGSGFFLVACCFALLLVTKDWQEVTNIEIAMPRTYPDTWPILFVLFTQFQAGGLVWIYGHMLPKPDDETVQITEELRL